MILTFLTLLFLFLLFYGMWTDLKSFHVDNKVTASIVLLSLPLIAVNQPWTQPLFYIRIVMAAVLLIFLLLNLMGSADIKVLLPVLFMLDVVGLMVFLWLLGATGLITGIVYHARYGTTKIPYFVPITISVAVVLITNLYWVLNTSVTGGIT